MGYLEQRIFFYRGYTQAAFLLMLMVYVWFFPPPQLVEESWLDTLMDVTGACALLIGELLRVWAVSHAGKCTRSRRLKANLLITSGPYAYIRNPIYVGNFLIGPGMVTLPDAIGLIPIYVILFSLQYGPIVAEEEGFLLKKFGPGFEDYCACVPRWLPFKVSALVRLDLGTKVPLKELATAWGVLLGGVFFDWLESPLHHQQIIGLYRWLADRIVVS